MPPPLEQFWIGSPKQGVCVVRAPLTFGHSQVLVTGLGPGLSEVAKLDLGIPLVRQAVEIFNAKLTGLVEEFHELATYTHTCGKYVKTAILRTSASEKDGEFKVHLAPLFESHLELANQRFVCTHPHASPPGGLIGWLGDRETLVDRQIETPKDPAAFPQSLVESFRLEAFATALREAVDP